MRSPSATDILRRHAIERYLRAAVRSANLDGDRGAEPRMNEAAWVDSCQLVRGVPAELLDVLGVRECQAAESTWNYEAAEHMGITYERQTDQVARPLTLAQAAARLGLELDQVQLKQLRLAAIATVTENLLRRQARNGVAA